MKNTPIRFLLAALAAAALPALANNLVVTNTALRPVDKTAVAVEFDLSWDNAWRDDVNHDAVWLFVKYSLDGGTNWSHATLRGSGVNPSGYSTGSDPALEFAVPADGRGAFVRPTAAGRRPVAATGVRLVWDLVADGIPVTARGRVSVHALEMVYVPEGPFFVGDNSSDRAFKVTRITTPAMTNTAATGAGTIASPYTNAVAGMGRAYGMTGVFSNGYPNGYNAYYVMKYELTRGRFLEFLNMLTATQAATQRLFQVNFMGPNPNILGTHPRLTNAQPWRAACFIGSVAPSHSGWLQNAGYLDWAGLRPMTEMEYEKAARGPGLPVDRGYPWGVGRFLITRLVNVNSPTEMPAIPQANLCAAGTYLSLIAGPLRNGAMARAGSDQYEAGASYYGVFELAGNAQEWAVASGSTVANVGSVPAGALAFTGQHGDGRLTALGQSDVAGWPVQAVSYGGGSIGGRGGDYTAGSLNCAISDRIRAGENYYTTHGIRGVRTAP